MKTDPKNHKNTLIQIGLSEGEAEVYELLISRGRMKAGEIIRRSTLKRGNVYNILNSLINKGLVEEFELKGVSVYKPTHPSALLDELEEKFHTLKKEEHYIESILPDLISAYNKSEYQPNVRHYEGISGLENLYKDILRTKKDIKLIRSSYDDDRGELAELVSKQIKQQVKNSIHVKAITPIGSGAPRQIIEKDAERLVTRRIIPREKFTIPAQIIIYGDKVGITSFKNTLLTTIIDNPDIRESFDTLFKYIWEKSEHDHKHILSTLV